MAQLGDLTRARTLLRRAARAFAPTEAVARARCIVAEAEIALVSRDLTWSAKALATARATLEARGDKVNAAYARHLEIRHLLLTGRLDAAEQLAAFDPEPVPPAVRAAHELVVAGIAMRRVRTKIARAALARAQRAAHAAGIVALSAEVEAAAHVLAEPAARLVAHGQDRLLRLDEVEALFSTGVLVIDACRHAVRDARSSVALTRRPVLFALARALAEAWPGDVPRGALIARAFRGKEADESHRARLRVEIGRLRRVLRPLAGVIATDHGFALVPQHAREVVMLGRPREEQHAAVLAFLADGEILVDLGAGAGAWVEPAHRAAGAGRAWHRRQGAIVRARACASLDGPACPGIHDDVVTPGSAPQWLERVPYPFQHRGSDMKRSAAEILEEYGPFAGAERVNGVTYDGQNVWFAAGNKLVAFEPTNGKMKRTIDVAAHAGTAFDGRHLFQIAEDRIQKIDPDTGRVLGSIPAPGGGGDSGLAWAEGTLWVGKAERAKSIKSILRPGRSSAQSTPTGSSRGSLGSRASSGTAPGKATKARCGALIRRAEKYLSNSKCRPASACRGWSPTAASASSAAAGDNGTVRAVRGPIGV